MSEQGLRVDATRGSPAVSRNYAFALVGAIIWPFVIVAYFIARRRRHLSDGIEQTHYAFQYRTTAVALIAFAVFSLITIAMFFWTPPQTTFVQFQMRFYLLGNAQWLVMLWFVVRCIRGLYLAASGRAIQNPKTLWVWAR
ncbi:MAG TPA: hypothetical protein VM468_13845 [Mycoplana sp.]|nr:hypothetical protein [Mycoplana sp.]